MEMQADGWKTRDLTHEQAGLTVGAVNAFGLKHGTSWHSHILLVVICGPDIIGTHIVGTVAGSINTRG
ncbi:unnamed protein product [marine sediment metagenome]|uniref:Uncharacterized protein n=1 Tax=marine sediment metagenome TaxID=412755 RepID=X0X4H8_9ZZZZ